MKPSFAVRPDIIPQLALFASDWCKYFSNQPAELIDLTVQLALGCEQGASQIINILLDTSLNQSNVGYHSVNAAQSVKNVCREMLELILQEIDSLIRAHGPQSANISLLNSVKRELSSVTPLLLNPNPLRVQTAVRILSLLGAQSPIVLVSSASSMLRKAETKFHLAALIRLVADNVNTFAINTTDNENTVVGNGYFSQAVEQAIRESQYVFDSDDTEAKRLFRNLTILLK